MYNFLVIGASSGIAYTLALQLAGSGNKVYATYNKNKFESENKLIEFHFLNVLDENIPFDFFPDVINGIVYCPGSISLRPFNRIKPEDFESDYQLQVIEAVKTIQAALPKLKNADNASAVLFSTVAEKTGLNFHSLVATSKGAIEGLTRALAAEFAPKIRVNCVAPSLIDTPLAASLINNDQKTEANAQRHPLKRFGLPKDITDITEFLLSEKSSWIIGQTFSVDGGMSSIKM